MTWIQFTLEKGHKDLWYITSPSIKGLLLVGHSRHEVLTKLDQALTDMEKAKNG